MPTENKEDNLAIDIMMALENDRHMEALERDNSHFLMGRTDNGSEALIIENNSEIPDHPDAKSFGENEIEYHVMRVYSGETDTAESGTSLINSRPNRGNSDGEFFIRSARFNSHYQPPDKAYTDNSESFANHMANRASLSFTIDLIHPFRDREIYSIPTEEKDLPETVKSINDYLW